MLSGPEERLLGTGLDGSAARLGDVPQSFCHELRSQVWHSTSLCWDLSSSIILNIDGSNCLDFLGLPAPIAMTILKFSSVELANIPVLFAQLLSALARKFRIKIASLIDWSIPISPRQICFVSRRNVPINGNLRIMIDALSKESDLHVIVYKEGYNNSATTAALQDQRVELIDHFSWRNLIKLLSSEVIVLSHSARDAYITRRKRGRRVVNLWHGVAIKRIEAMMLPRGSRASFYKRRRRIIQNSFVYDALIASNPVDQLVNSLSFLVPHHKVIPIGLPRFDYLIKPWQMWPSDLHLQRQSLLTLLKGRRFVLWAPTFREQSKLSLENLITANDRQLIDKFCIENEIVLGIRPHPYWEGQQELICNHNTIINVGSTCYPEPAVPLSLAESLVADYSSIWVDYLLMKRPIIGFVPDLEAYLDKERSFIYPYKNIFPGPQFKCWNQVLEMLRQDAQVTIIPSKNEIMFLPWGPANEGITERCRGLVLSQFTNRDVQ